VILLSYIFYPLPISTAILCPSIVEKDIIAFLDKLSCLIPFIFPNYRKNLLSSSSDIAIGRFNTSTSNFYIIAPASFPVINVRTSCSLSWIDPLFAEILVPTGVKPGFLILMMSSSSSEGLLLSFLSLLNMSSEGVVGTLMRLKMLCS